METFSQKFRDWMDAHRLRAEDVAKALHLSEQTVRNWRSVGIPPRKRSAVEEFMQNYQSRLDARLAELRIQTIVIETTREEFRQWNAAALAEGKLIEDWIKDGLNRLAQGDR